MASEEEGGTTSSEEVFDFPFAMDTSTVEFLKQHGRVMFIVRGLQGTLKTVLSQLLCDRYPEGIVYRAHSYFKDLPPPERNKQTQAMAHGRCRKKVLEACAEGKTMIIVQNSHVRKMEMQAFINYAAEYNYTVIMAITTRKLAVNPEELKKSDKEYLTKPYIRDRLKQWEEVIPIATGWFVCPEDTSYLFSQLQMSIETLLDDGKFCRVFDVYERENLLKRYMARRQLYCKAAYCYSLNDNAMEMYYLSDEVQDSYGKAFSIVLDGYVIHRYFIAAVVQVENLTKNLTLANAEEVERNRRLDIEDRFAGQLHANDNLLDHERVHELNQEFSDSMKTIQLLDREQEQAVNVKDCRFIYFAHKKFAHFGVNKVDQLCSSLLSPFANGDGNIEHSKYAELNEDVHILRLSEEVWYIQVPKQIKFQSVFTGLYI